MKRAAVLIGVDKAGDLPKLKDAARGARLMETWAKAQGMDPVHVITDEQAPVSASDIRNVVRALVDAANVQQLLVYFAGHGANLQRQEYWMLTDAPDDTQAAVNVATSVALAATCGIPHVVLVSDACRTAPEGIRAQSVRGSEIFPNREADTAPVDQFYACQLGMPSHEVRDPAVTCSEFEALYTRELVPALLGRRPRIVEWSTEANKKVGRVHLRPLRDFLSTAMAERLKDLQLQSKVIQVPVAQISSDPPAWISQVETDAALGFGGLGGGGPSTTIPAPESIATDLLRSALAIGNGPLRGGLPPGTPPSVANGVQDADLARIVARLEQPFGLTHHETACGFKLRGARVVDAVAHSARVEFAANSVHGEDLRVVGASRPASNVLLVLESGAGVLLPAIPDFLCALSFEGGELVDVAYEPSDNTRRWADYKNRARENRALRAIASSAMARGIFKLESGDALAIDRRMQRIGVDPSLAVYVAYACHELQRPDLVRGMEGRLQADLGAPPFDVALLARRLDRAKYAVGNELISPIPLISQGWALMQAFGVKTLDVLQPLVGLRLPSLWTMFEARGVERVRRAIASGDLP